MATTDEWEVKDLSGLKLEILKRPVKKTSPLPKLEPSTGPVTPEFPADLTVTPVSDPLKTNWFPWSPSGVNNTLTSNICSQEALRDHLWSSTSAAVQARAVNDWLLRCNKEIAGPFSRHTYLTLMKFATVSYDFHENPNIRMVRATLPDGRVLSGIIAMKPDDTPRPFIIAKCGIFCNSEQSTTQRFFMMHLFDETPFHVLALASNTGSDFQVENKAFSLGGFDEGRQLFEIAQLVRSSASPIRKRISSVHVVGASLGGNAALYAGLYASANIIPPQEGIQSVTATCPVVVLENSARRLFSAQPISTLASFETIHHLRGIYSFVPVLGQYFPPNMRWLKGKKLFDRLMKAVVAYYHDWTAKKPWDLKPFTGLQIDSLEQFWHLNDFRHYVSQVTVPTMTISADNDGFITSNLNSQLLNQTLHKASNNNVGNIFLKQGNHCAFAIANGWGNYSMILREYILSHSPEAKDYWKEIQLSLPNQGFSLSSNEKILGASWMAHEGDDFLILQLKVSGGFHIIDRELNIPIPIKTLPWDFTAIPQSSYEVGLLTRFANTRFSVVDEKGELVANSNHAPKYIKAWVWR